MAGVRVPSPWYLSPPIPDSSYQLPHPMSHYGRCDFSEVVAGLEDFFVDCITLADSASPEIDFASYGSHFLFHAGADRQSDIGFPETCSDLFSGYIKFGGEVWVDDSTHAVRDGLMMPETNVQDNRATALNALLAHEFGHQLGLVDLYSTENFFSQVGDFALMDNNGFGTGIEFSFESSTGDTLAWPIGKVFGAVPLYPCAWSRAFLGLDEVRDFRSDTTGVEIVAAALTDDPGLKIARLPISETEYFLAEIRLVDVDQRTPYIRADAVTSVFQGMNNANWEYTNEYDYLMPGEGGMLIYHVDEEVAALDYDGDGQNNFLDNDLQWFRDERKFLSLVEASGVVHFGGYYRAGYGSQDDFFRDDQWNSFTPNTNPSTVGNSGSNSHISMTNIERVTDTTKLPDDRRMRFDLEVDRRVEGFPVRSGAPLIGLAPVADDLDGDGTDELIVAANDMLSVMTTSGDDFIRTISDCTGCPVHYDTVVTSVNRGIDINPAATYVVPLYARTPAPITAGPVTGDLDAAAPGKLVAVGHQHETLPGFSTVAVYEPVDDNDDAEADVAFALLSRGVPIALSFGDSTLYALPEADTSRVFRWRLPGAIPQEFRLDFGDLLHGQCRIDDYLVVMSSDTLSGQNDSAWLMFVADSVYSFGLEGIYAWGPIVVDVDLDGTPEVVAFTPEGDGVFVSIDTVGGIPAFSILNRDSTGYLVTTNPIAGDVDLDGRPDIIAGGLNQLLAFNSDFIIKTGFPREIDDRYPLAHAIAAPIMSDIEAGGMPELIFPTTAGNFYSYGDDTSYGFPLSSGAQHWLFSNSSAAVFNDSTGGKLGYLGGDGWFYAWEVDADAQTDFWPMNGADPAGTFAFDMDRLPAVAAASTTFDESRYYNYPNPTRDGVTRIRYFLGAEASSVRLNIYDLSGVEVARLEGTTVGGADNEVVWDCGDVIPGVYRCVIEVDYSGTTETAFTDIAVLR